MMGPTLSRSESLFYYFRILKIRFTENHLLRSH